MDKYILNLFFLLILLTGNAFVTFGAETKNQYQFSAFENKELGIPFYLSQPGSNDKNPDPNGFIQRWFLLEPIRQSVRSNQQLTDSFVQAAIKREYFPGQFTVVPHDGDKVTANSQELTWYAVDSSRYNINLYSFAYALGKPTFNVLFWAVTIIHCPEEMSEVRLAVGSNSASIWWVNEKEVIGIYGDRHMIIDDGVSKRLTLKKGPNVIRGAVINSPGLSDFCARFLDKDGKPLKDFTISLNGYQN